MNKATESKANELIQSAMRQLSEAGKMITTTENEGDVYHLIDKTNGRFIGERPTMLSAQRNNKGQFVKQINS